MNLFLYGWLLGRYTKESNTYVEIEKDSSVLEREQKIISYLKNNQFASANEIALSLNLPVSKISGSLIILVRKGQILMNKDNNGKYIYNISTKNLS